MGLAPPIWPLLTRERDTKSGGQKGRPFALNYSTPVVRGEEITVIGPGKIAGYEARTGKEMWAGTLPVASYVASPAVGSTIAFALSYSVEQVPSFDDQLKNLDRNKDGKLGPDEYGTGDNARIVESVGQMYGNKDGTVERAEWMELWREWVGRPALTGARLGGAAGGWPPPPAPSHRPAGARQRPSAPPGCPARSYG